MAYSSKCPGLQPEPCHLAILRAPKGAKTAPSSHQPTVTLAKPPLRPSALLRKDHTTRNEGAGTKRAGASKGAWPQADRRLLPAVATPQSWAQAPAPDWPVSNLSGCPNQLSAVGPAGACSTWPQLLQPCLWANQRSSLAPSREHHGDGREPTRGPMPPPEWTQASGASA